MSDSTWFRRVLDEDLHYEQNIANIFAIFYILELASILDVSIDIEAQNIIEALGGKYPTEDDTRRADERAWIRTRDYLTAIGRANELKSEDGERAAEEAYTLIKNIWEEALSRLQS
jgi:hypothetical protein